MFGLRRKWSRLRSGLYVPPLLRRLHRDERGLWYPCCTEGGGPCDHCVGTTPTDLLVDLVGIVEGSCGSCGQFDDDTYTLTWREAAGGTCYWGYEFPSALCAIDGLMATLAESGGTYYLTIRLVSPYPSGGTKCDFRAEYDPKPDCSSWSNEECPHLDSPFFTCDASSASAFVTAA